MTTWAVAVCNNIDGDEVLSQEQFPTVEEAKVAVFDIISNAGPGHVQVEYANPVSTVMRLHVSPVNPGPEVWTAFYVFIFELK